MTEALPDDDAKKGTKKKKVTLSSVWRWYLTSIDLSQLRSIELNGHSLFSHWGHSPKKAVYCIQDSLYYHILLFTTTFFSYFYIFSVYLFLFLCLYVITMFYHFCSLLFIYHFISKIFSIYFQTCIFQFLQTYIFQFL